MSFLEWRLQANALIEDCGGGLVATNAHMGSNYGQATSSLKNRRAIGANAIVFSVPNALVLRPLHVPHPRTCSW
jgi:hypothetical protein